MKSLKKTLVLLVVFSMILSAVMPAFAATDVYGLDCEEEVARLEALDVVSGYEDGTFGPENTITRAEMAVILCKMVGIDEVTADENKVVPSKFNDVKVGEWYTGYVNVAAGKNLLSGFPDGTFRPSEQLTMNQVLTLCVNALGRGEYVAEMGAWPANYIAEATKLGLLDGVKTSDANRGNVAVIVWNTLEAPYVWDVTNTEYEGTINLGNSTRSLLSIFFRDFVAEDAKDNAYLKEAEYVEVTAVPSTNGELGENQIVLANTVDTDAEAYAVLVKDIRENKKPRGTDDEEWTTVNGGEITAYAPEFNNLDSYFGKIVTVIFGKDNEVVSIRVVDDTVDEFLTAWEDSKLEIGENKYKFADDARVYINTVEMTSEGADCEHECDASCATTCQHTAHDANCGYEAATTAAGAMTKIGNILKGTKTAWDWAKYNKVIKANVVLNGKGKVTRLDLLVSGNYDAIGTYEAIVEKVRHEEITLDDGRTIDYSEDVDEDDLPRVIKDGAIVEVSEIAVGDVLTYFVKNNEVKTVYVSSNKVEGELTRASKTDFKLTVDGNAYYSSMEKLLVTDDKIADAKSVKDVDNYIGENIELYLNVYGEYVLMASDEAAEAWVFGVVTSVRDTEEDEEDDDIYRIPVRILLADGSISRTYKFVYDVEEDGAAGLNTWENTTVPGLENKFIVFAPDANGEIAVGDYQPISLDNNNGAIADGDYEVEYVTATTSVDDKRERISNKNFTDSTVIFNLKTNDPETSKSWRALVTTDDKLAQNSLLVFEEDSKVISYILINVNDYATSDAQYAVVVTEDYKEKKGSTTKKYTELLTLDGVEEFETKTLADKYTEDMKDMFIEYALSGDKLATSSVKVLIDLPEFEDLKVTEKVAGTMQDGSETLLLVDLKGNKSGATEVTAAQKTACTCGAKTGNHDAACTVKASQPVDATTDLIACEECKETATHGKTCTVGGYTTDAVDAIKANLKVVGTQKDLLEYEDDEDEVGYTLGEVNVDEDVIVLDARNGELKEITFSALRDEVEAEGYVYVVPFANKDANGYFSTGTTVQTDITKIDANILVIVD